MSKKGRIVTGILIANKSSRLTLEVNTGKNVIFADINSIQFYS